MAQVSSLKLAPVSELRVSRHHIPAFAREGFYLPNSKATGRPLLIYHGAFASREQQQQQQQPLDPSAIESHLSRVGVVEPQWRYTMYPTTHFHSTTHEVLCVSGGRARLCFGGEENPGRVEPVVGTGDVMVVPAGVAHRLLEDLTPGGSFHMVGSYPPGSSWDMCYGKEADEKDSVERIKGLPWLGADPIYGQDGPAMDDVQ